MKPIKSDAQRKAMFKRIADKPVPMMEPRVKTAASAYKATAKGTPNIKGLPSFMHGKSAGRSMVLRGGPC